MAFPEINEETVYLTAGAALPITIDRILVSLLNDSFTESYKKLLNVIFSCFKFTYAKHILLIGYNKLRLRFVRYIDRT
jgi:hypothetical protein